MESGDSKKINTPRISKSDKGKEKLQYNIYNIGKEDCTIQYRKIDMWFTIAFQRPFPWNWSLLWPLNGLISFFLWISQSTSLLGWRHFGFRVWQLLTPRTERERGLVTREIGWQSPGSTDQLKTTCSYSGSSLNGALVSAQLCLLATAFTKTRLNYHTSSVFTIPVSGRGHFQGLTFPLFLSSRRRTPTYSCSCNINYVQLTPLSRHCIRQ